MMHDSSLASQVMRKNDRNIVYHSAVSVLRCLALQSASDRTRTSITTHARVPQNAKVPGARTCTSASLTVDLASLKLIL